jgi:hypothetical protein
MPASIRIAGDRLDRVCERQQDGDRGHGAHARQDADQVADQHPEHAPHEVGRLQRNAEAVPEVQQ